jgi:signal transduction histidine kinase/DNA-binding response OmpR family regulator
MQLDDIKILVVDDRVDKAKSIEAVLTDIGDVVLAHSGKDALRLLLNQDFAVVLLDVRMPGMDGFETAELIRGREASESTPIIFITSFGDSDISRGYSLGAVDYIIAPVVPEILRAKVSVLVELHRKTKEVKLRAEERIHLMNEQMARATAEAARKAAEDAEMRAAFLADATGLMAATLDSEQLLDSVAQRAVPKMFDYFGIHAVRPDGNIESICSRGLTKTSSSEQIEKATAQTNGFADPLYKNVLKEGRSLYVTELSEFALRSLHLNPDQIAAIEKHGFRSLIVAPMVARGRAFGVLTVATSQEGRMLTKAEQLLAEDLGQRIAISLDNSRLYKEAQIANRLKDEFLAIVSHELRTPLTPILGWTAMLRKKQLHADEAMRGLEIIDRNVRTQVKIIEDLLDVSRIVSGKLHLNPKAFEPIPLIESCLESIRAAVEAKSINLGVDIQRSCPPIVADEQRVQQIVWNLLSNAVKFTPSKGSIFVKVQRTEQFLQIKVKDTGKGISSEFLPHVFERFRQADSTTTRAYGGLGLGLSIVRQLTELHGGTATVDSEGEGKGTTFTITLPYRKGSVSVVSNSMPAVDVKSQGALSGIRVLVVDDEPDSRQIIAMLLERQGAIVEEVASVSSAMEALTRFNTDVVISDIGMPGEDGYALVQQLRSHAVLKYRDLPALALSAYVRPEDERRSIDAGFNMHLGKPAEIESLTKALLELIVQRRPDMMPAKLALEPGRNS